MFCAVAMITWKQIAAINIIWCTETNAWLCCKPNQQVSPLCRGLRPFFLRAVSFETTRCVRDLITSLLGTICDVMQISIWNVAEAEGAYFGVKLDSHCWIQRDNDVASRRATWVGLGRRQSAGLLNSLDNLASAELFFIYSLFVIHQ